MKPLTLEHENDFIIIIFNWYNIVYRYQSIYHRLRDRHCVGIPVLIQSTKKYTIRRRNACIIHLISVSYQVSNFLSRLKVWTCVSLFYEWVIICLLLTISTWKSWTIMIVLVVNFLFPLKSNSTLFANLQKNNFFSISTDSAWCLVSTHPHVEMKWAEARK